MNKCILLLLFSIVLLAQSNDCHNWGMIGRQWNCVFQAIQFVGGNQGLLQCDSMKKACIEDLGHCEIKGYGEMIKDFCNSPFAEKFEYCLKRLDAYVPCVQRHFTSNAIASVTKMKAQCGLLKEADCVKMEIVKKCRQEDIITWQRHIDQQNDHFGCKNDVL